jgi:hypothetical protein
MAWQGVAGAGKTYALNGDVLVPVQDYRLQGL